MSTDARPENPTEETIQVVAPIIELNTPPKTLGRNSYGLLNDITYHFNEYNFVDWKKMVNPKYLVVNAQNDAKRDKLAAKYNKKFEDITIEETQDEDLLILLAGIKDVLAIRGYKKVSYLPIYATGEIVSVRCQITFTGNYETGFRDIEFEAIADASCHNTKSFAANFLTTIAENRAFTRCVRNFLRINIVGQEEINDSAEVKSESIEAPTPYSTLEDKMKEKGVLFEQLKNKCMKAEVPNCEKWESIKNIPKDKILDVIGIISKKPKKEAKEPQSGSAS